MKKEKLKIGILLNNLNVSAWQYKLLETIVRSDYATIELIVKNNSQLWHQPLSLAHIWKKRARLFHHLHILLDRKLHSVKSDCLAIKNTADLLAGIPLLECSPKETQFVDRLSASDVETIQSYELDVIIRLGFRILKGPILKAAKYGIWSYHHGDNRVNRGGPPAYWEVIEQWPETGAILQILSEDLDGGQVIYRSWGPTRKLTIHQNLNNVYWRSVSFVPRVLKVLYEKGEPGLKEWASRFNYPLEFYDRKLYHAPSNILALRHLLKQIAFLACLSFRRLLLYDNWTLYYHISKKNGPALSFRQYKSLPTPKNSFWADPFVCQKEGKYYIFFEELPYNTQKGHISLITLDEKGQYEGVQTVLKKDYHLSYPFIFEWENQWYMIPESSENGTIELYRCTRFPDQWEWVMNLMENISAADATLIYHDYKWWLFAAVDDTNGLASYNDELFLYYADDLFSQNWHSHPSNPIVSDVKKSRPAGKIFWQDGKLIRPSQDCSGQYGSAVNFNEILQLTETHYEEKFLFQVKPNWDKTLKGMHTFNFDKNISIIDGFSFKRKI